MNDAYAFEQSVLSTIRAHGALAPADRVLVAVSGGADSTALISALVALRERGAVAVDLAVAHLNHRLRAAASERDAVFVRDLASRLGLPFFLGACDELASLRSNREAAARRERHAFLARCAQEWGATRTALAHTRDDQAETLLMRLARGAGPASLAGMRVVRADGLVRPLLEQSHGACLAYLRARRLEWVEDESNADPSFFRNRVRRRLLPLLEAELGVDVRARLARLADELHQESALAEQRIDDLLPAGRPGAALPLDVLRRAGIAAPRVLHGWLARAGVRAGSRQIAMILGVAAGGDPSGEVVLGGGFCVRRCYGELGLARTHDQAACTAVPARLDIPGRATIPGWELHAETVASPAGAAAAMRGTAGRSLLDGDLAKGPLWVRGPRPGDRVHLSYGRRKLADILIDAKIPRHERTTLAVIGCGRDVLWVPGVVRSVIADPGGATRGCVMLRAERTSGVERRESSAVDDDE
ncbi:tRNA lysidine(34) synthetase TilS [Candidatus Binatia bacterium]|nr:tRNA lysidine(34) synthetase TilS [Candidatus Binatia bacterium]